ncbi:LysE family translocator [Salininema proteolyticum]|uniref:LysE family translocator n=1 Tax=Salininema proteolyticum TaxID=1607685 RepID=A0ABV8U3D1_9ACTN
MVEWTAMAGISLVALGMVLTPGPNMIYLVSRTITQGRKAGFVSLAGIAGGVFVYLVGAVAGISAIFALVPALYTALKIAGAVYLLWLAWQALRPGGTSAFAPKDLQVDPPRRLFAMGMLTSLLNPKLAILYVSLLPQFIDPASGPVAAQSLVLGLTQMAVGITVNGLIVCGAGGIAAFLAERPLWTRIQRYFMGTVLGAMAIHLAVDKTRPAAALP